MSNFATTATSAHAWLRTNIAAALGIPTFNRVLTGTDVPDTFVVVGAVKKDGQDVAGMGDGRRDERYTISCLIRTFSGPDASGTISAGEIDTLYDNLWAYVNGVAALVAPGMTVNGVTSDRTLGGAVLFAQFTGADELEPVSPENGGVEAAITFDISCRGQVER